MPLWSWWLSAAVVLFIIEIITPGLFFFACLSVGALAACLCSLLSPPPVLLWFVFIAVALISMYTIRPLAKKYFVTHQQHSNIDALIGQTALVTEAIRPPALGLVKIEGEIWRAEAAMAVESGTRVIIKAVAGTRVQVSKVDA
jgi:membrane protein implicated in regulation of membrane protease activity